MGNPWEEISLEDYENHMKLDTVRQLQGLNELMKDQLGDYPASRVMILGIAGGNGLEHIQTGRFEKIYGVDVNAAYLEAAAARYPELNGVLECLCIDLTEEPCRLPEADLVVANLLIEYIGYECFQKAIRHVRPEYVSCIIQINKADSWVSGSPYLHVFDRLEQVHHDLDSEGLEKAMAAIGCQTVKRLEHGLPNGKKFLRIDFQRV